MHKGLLLLAALPAALEIRDIGDVFLIAIKFLVACVAAFLAWLALGPVARGLYRAAFQKPMPNAGVTATRLIGGIGIGVLVFLFVPLDFGRGRGSDGPGGQHAGKDGKGGTDSGKGKNGKGDQVGPTVPPSERV